jgi:tetratricopeptide (TPR) repeat protein
MRGDRDARPRAWSVILLLVLAVGTQVAADGVYARAESRRSVLWVRSTEVVRRLALGFDTLGADVYWIRAVQYYGSTKLSEDPDKDYERLYPLLDMTTTLDPHFRIAYRFGAILLSEPFPNGPGRPDQAIALLEKGIRRSPERWEYYHDAGFVEYWWRRDFEKAAEWFLRGSEVPGAPEWLRQVAPAVLAEGGERESARAMWLRMSDTEQEWMKEAAGRGLMHLDAEAAVEQLQVIVNRFRDATGRFPSDWNDLVRVRQLPGIPLDPTGEPYALDPASGAVDVAHTSPLFPLRRSRTAQ